MIHENQQQIERILDRPWLGLAGTGGSVGFLEIFIGDGVRFCGSAKLNVTVVEPSAFAEGQTTPAEDAERVSPPLAMMFHRSQARGPPCEVPS